ncbi:MAG: hypothetical protein ACRDZ3_22775 [Acidimicrobiia bacterium]
MPSSVAPSAQAHDGHADWFKWREPEDNSDVTGEKVYLRGKVHFEEGINRWSVQVLPPDGYATVQAWGIVCQSAEEGEKSDKPKTVEISCEWNTTTYPNGNPSQNHAYRARINAWNEKDPDADQPPPAEEDESGDEKDVEAQARDDDDDDGGDGGDDGDEDETTTSSSASTSSSTSSTTTTTTTTAPSGDGDTQVHRSPWRTLVVANPPKAPEGVTLKYARKASEVTVSWQPNTEPDIAGYLVEERFDSGDWSLVAKPTETSWTGKLEKEGTYRFRVAAIRYVGSKQRVKEGPRREPQDGMREVKFDPDEGSTTTTEPEEESSGDGKRKDREDDKKRKEDDKRKKESAEATTSTTAPPESLTTTYDSAAGESTSTTGDPGSGPAASGLAAIEPGTPGSVQTRYADPPSLPAPVSPDQAYDPGFSLALPYPKEVRLDIGPPPAAPPRLLGTVALFDSNEDQRRALVGVLAGGLVVFMVSMQAAYLNRRPRPIDLAASTDWD